MNYQKPNTSDDYRASAQECIDRAQRVLEVAELNLDRVSELFNYNKDRVGYENLLAHAEARTRLGMAWADLAEVKAVTDPFAGVDS